jgi:AraC family transcriptional regulator
MPANISPALRKKILSAAQAAERQLDDNITIATLAEMAGLSDKHFQRCFKQILGESPKRYLRRLRLQAAAYHLKWSDAAVTDLALRFGFESHAGFTKAFSKAYGTSPQAFRAASEVTPYLRFPREIVGEFDLAAAQVTQLVVRVEEQPSRRAATMRHVGPIESMAGIWKPMIAWAKRHSLFSESAMLLGIHNDYWDEPSADRYRYDAGIVVPEDFDADDEVQIVRMPGGAVAMTEFSGSVAMADEVWRQFVDQWLPVSGFKLRTGTAYDVYPPSLFEEGILRTILRTLSGVRATFCIPITAN